MKALFFIVLILASLYFLYLMTKRTKFPEEEALGSSEEEMINKSSLPEEVKVLPNEQKPISKPKKPRASRAKKSDRSSVSLDNK